MILANSKQRILQYIKYKGITKAAFYEETCITRGLLDKDKMDSSVSDVVLAKILVKYTDINSHWLITGEGEMLKNNIPPTPTNSDNSERIQELKEMISVQRDRIKDLEQQVTDFQKERKGIHGTMATVRATELEK